MPIRPFALLMVAMFAACTIERTPRAGLADPVGVARAEINDMLGAYQRAVLDADPRRVAAFFAPTARLYLPDSPDIVGRGAIDAAFAAMYRDNELVEIRMESDDIDVGIAVAHQFGTFHQVLRDTAGTEQSVNGRFLIRWLRGPETTWQIERMMINRVPVDSSVVVVR